MDIIEFEKILQANAETEHLEFKSASEKFSFESGSHSLCGYCIALANERGGKLILGVTDKLPRKVIGTRTFRNIGKLKTDIFRKIGRRIGVEELEYQGKRVLIIDIPSRPVGEPLHFEGRYLMRIGEELVPMTSDQINMILSEKRPDWSAEMCSQATLDDLDPEAIAVARANFRKKNPKIAEVEQWDDATFLNKAKLTVRGKVTNAALILLGRPESSVLLSPVVAEITWVLIGGDGTKRDYEHFGPPFLLSVDRVYAKIRNLKYRYIQEGTLFPEEVDMYDPWVIREALHNCIAHQDYSLSSRITVTENENGSLLFSNAGSFTAGSIEKVISEGYPQQYYRNKLLVESMVQLNMIDTIGSGIPKMFEIQRKRFFPMPSYNLGENRVDVMVIGKVINADYTRILAQRDDLTLSEVVLLDYVQKGVKVDKNVVGELRRKKLIEGRYPNVYVSQQVAEESGQKAQYMRNRGLDDRHYKASIVEYVRRFPGASRKDIDDFIIPKLPEILEDYQKRNKVNNLLASLSRVEKTIVNKGNDRAPRWFTRI